MFPWFVHMRLAAQSDATQFRRKPITHQPRSTVAYANVPPQQRMIMLRHNVLSAFLANQLEEEYPGRVRVEEAAGSGGTFDVLVLSPLLRKEGGDLYEIKVASTAGSAVRQALGQLLEYAHRAPGVQPARLYVAAEPALDAVTGTYLEQLRSLYGLPIHYHRIEMPGPAFVEPEDEIVQRLRHAVTGSDARAVDATQPALEVEVQCQRSRVDRPRRH